MADISIEQLWKLATSIRPIWTSGWGLFAGEILLLTALSSLLAPLNGDAPLITTGVALASAVILAIVWRVSNALPRATAGKIGILLCIDCDTKATSDKVRDDFVKPFKKMLRSGALGASFDFLEVPQHIASSTIDYPDAEILRSRCGAHFMLYGRARDREIGSKPSYMVELDGVVVHKVISKERQKGLQSEFAELLPRKLVIDKASDVLSFEFTSEWAELVSKYIIASAAAVSGNLEYAESLFVDCQVQLEAGGNRFHVFDKIRSRIPDRLGEIYAEKANSAYDAWVETCDDVWVDWMGQCLEKLQGMAQTDVRSRFLEAIYVFLSKRDFSKAMKVLEQVGKPSRDALWHMNYAFLCAYGGDLKKAVRHYDLALRDMAAGSILAVQPYLITRIEEFVYLAVSREPVKGQLWLCLGFINWKFKRDWRLGCMDFERFLRATSDCSGFEAERGMVQNWILEISSVDAANDPENLEGVA